jgi:aldose sugar dehydrogenase
MGDAAVPATAADPTDLRGTILRIRPDGSIPADNPFPGSPVLAYGFRDVQGLAWAPANGRLWATEHGPTGLEAEGFRRDRDELNRVEPGGDHGWPRVSGRVVLEGTVTPVVEWTPSIAPSGLAFVTDRGSPWYGHAFVAALRGMHLRRIVLDHQAAVPVCQEILLLGEYGRLRSVREGPGGALLVTTSNRDRRGAPGPRDDLLLRVRPAGPGPGASLDRP